MDDCVNVVWIDLEAAPCPAAINQLHNDRHTYNFLCCWVETKQEIIIRLNRLSLAWAVKVKVPDVGFAVVGVT